MRNGQALEIRYTRLRPAFGAALHFAVAVAFRLGPEAGIPWPFPDWLALTLILIIALQGVRLSVIALAPGGPALTIGAEGIEIGKPAIGFVPWARIESIQLVGRMFRRKQLVIRFREPHPRFPQDGLIYLPVTPALMRDMSSLEVNLYFIDRSLAEITGALARFWPAFEPELPPPA
ncbi:MAG: hypothetical protein QNJ94_04855 [Alphaproteobacteria bacterium]|nr:hypothetical protein [Alphaproteobacteria bacterium]